MGALAIFIIIIILVIIIGGIRIITEYERGVVFRLGRVIKHVKNPGIRVIIPFIDHMQKVSLRIITLPIQSQKIITKDNVSIDVAAVAYYNVKDPIRSIVEIENVVSAVYQIAQTTVRNVVGNSSLDEVLSQTGKINEAIKGI